MDINDIGLSASAIIKKYDKEIDHWLSFNDQTVAKLLETALTGNKTVLPILADALEDAGCSMYHLLNHLRKHERLVFVPDSCFAMLILCKNV